MLVDTVLKPHPQKVSLVDLGTTDYESAWNIQKVLQKKLIENEIGHSLIICQHHPVITLGKSAKDENLLLDQDNLKALGINVFRIERGGDITYHGPGQLIAYPIFNLNYFKKDVGWYLRALEETVIKTTVFFGVQAQRIKDRTGVWIKTSSNDNFTFKTEKAKKIASVGIRLSRWCSMHGVGFNILDDLSGFSWINPCGLKDIEMTSLYKEVGSILPGDRSMISDEGLFLQIAKEKWLENFSQVFNLNLYSGEI